MASNFELALIAGQTTYHPLDSIKPPPGWSVVLDSSNDDFLKEKTDSAVYVRDLAKASDHEGTCALTSVANLLTQSGKPTTEGEVVRRAANSAKGRMVG